MPPIPETPATALRVSALTKRYGPIEAVRGATFDVAAGEIFALFGPNGAGKTTLFECILGLRRPDAGSIEILGADALADPEAAKVRVGAQLQASSLQDTVSPREAFGLFGSFYPDPLSPEALLSRFGLEAVGDRRFGSLSGGERQRVLLALAFVGNPALVILDEPTAGLDARSRRELHTILHALRGSGTTVVLSTHMIDDAEFLCDRVAVLDAGRIVATGAPQALVERAAVRPRIVVRTATPLSPETVAALAAVSAASRDGPSLILRSTDVNATLDSLLARADRLTNPLVDVRVRTPSLEDALLELIGKPEADPAQPP